jgi:hypothetical protein
MSGKTNQTGDIAEIVEIIIHLPLLKNSGILPLGVCTDKFSHLASIKSSHSCASSRLREALLEDLLGLELPPIGFMHG